VAVAPFLLKCRYYCVGCVGRCTDQEVRDLGRIKISDTLIVIRRDCRAITVQQQPVS
jgi:dissimilatory sulfite reductase (desulfoviridin) alpha/beta subunit